MAAARVGDPRPGQVEFPVDERVPGWGHIGQVDRDLGVLGAPGRPGVLALHPGRGSAFLHIPGFVDDQNRAGVTKALSKVVPQVIPDTVGIPPGPPQQVLHPARRPVASMLRDRPAVLPGQVRQ
jgi:hypothetical protein